MENPYDANRGLRPPIKHHVFFVFDSPHAWPKIVTSTALKGRFRYALEAICKTIEVYLGLLSSPGINCVIEDRLEIGFGQF